MLEDFKVACYRIELSAGEKGLILPPYKGATLRGAFGITFRRIVCTTRLNECNDCMLKESCPYSYIFETSPPSDTKVLSKNESISRPFIIEPPSEVKTHYKNGDSFTFGLVLVGKAIDYLPYFVLAFKEIGQIGIGKMRNPYNLKRFIAINPLRGAEKEIYSDISDKLCNYDLSFSGKDAYDMNSEISLKQVNLNFITMTRIKHDGFFVRNVEFHMLIRALLRRLSTLYYFHHGEELKADFKSLINKAENVKMVLNKTGWTECERYSQRQDARLNMGGIVGQVSYQGDLGEFLPFLRLGELVHVGKGCTFGLGKYQMF